MPSRDVPRQSVPGGALRRAVTRALVVALAATVALGAGVVHPPAAEAAVASDFRAGNIISDALFFDGSAMTADDVQAFLNLKGAACTSSSCLRNYVTASVTEPAATGLCNGYTGVAAETAAQIIAKVGASCGISQKVLLVTLQKESSMITRTTPGNYATAMGYACPDTGTCDPTYGTFFGQVYFAARQFKRYAQNPRSYTYIAGRDNTILYSPRGAAACGSSSVYIENQATAGLYIYTPYQPNAAALANLYGTGDACSAYGNRNFWAFYTDWFGSTQVGANLVRTAADPTVYLITFDHKFPVDSVATLAALSPLGQVATVQPDLLAARTTGPTLGRVLRGRDGTMYLVDGGRRLMLPSCAVVAAYGYDCAAYTQMALNDVQIAAFPLGPTLTQVATVAGQGTFYVQGGQKHESASADALAAAAPGIAATALSASTLATLPLGQPVVVDGSVLTTLGDGGQVVDLGGTAYRLPTGLAAATRLKAAPTGSLSAASIGVLTAGPDLGGFLDTGGSDLYAPTASGLLAVPRVSAPAIPVAVVPQPVVDEFGTAQALSGPLFAMAPGGPTVYLLSNGSKRPVASPAALVALNGGSWPTIAVLGQAAMDALPTGAVALAPASLVKSSSAPDVYFVDGLDGRVWLPSFVVTDQLGVSGVTTVSDSVLAGYGLRSGSLTTTVSCGGQNYIAFGGRLVPVTAADAFGLTYRALDATTCALLAKAPAGQPFAGPLFVQTPGDPTVYVVANGTKRPVASPAALVALNGGSWPSMIAVFGKAALDALPTGPTALAPATLMKAASAPQVYFVDGLGGRVYLPSFVVTDQLGVSGVAIVPTAVVNGYQLESGELTTTVSCGGQSLIATAGKLVPVTATGAYGLTYRALDATTCAALAKAPAGQAWSGPLFVKSATDPTVFVVSAGTKRPVGSPAALVALNGGTWPSMIAVFGQSALDALPTGPVAS